MFPFLPYLATAAQPALKAITDQLWSNVPWFIVAIIGAAILGTLVKFGERALINALRGRPKGKTSNPRKNATAQEGTPYQPTKVTIPASSAMQAANLPLTGSRCDSCGSALGGDVAEFCRRRSKRFGGKLFCRGCQAAA